MATITAVADDVDTGNGTSYTNINFTPAVDDLIVHLVATSGSVEPTAAGAVTDNQSGTYTLVAFALRSSSASSVYAFVRDQAVASAVTHTLTFACSGDAATGCCQKSLLVAGMSKYGAAAIRQSKVSSNNAAGGTPAIAFDSSCLFGNVTIAIVGAAANPPAITQPTNWTEQTDNGVNTPSQGFEIVSRESGFDGNTITWGGTSAAAFGLVAIELDTPSGLVPRNPSINHTATALLMQGWRRSLSGLWRRPEIWLPDGALAA